MERILRARELLESHTPMKSDCGALCGGACCKGSDEDGMALLPGEAALYQNADWCRVIRRGEDDILICRGVCPRKERPFACRIFPLFVKMTAEKTTLVLDPLAKSVCPLAGGSVRALDREFVKNAKEALRALLSAPATREFFKRQSALRDEAFQSPLFSPFD